MFHSVTLLASFQIFKKKLAPCNYVDLVPDFHIQVEEFSIYFIKAFSNQVFSSFR